MYHLKQLPGDVSRKRQFEKGLQEPVKWWTQSRQQACGEEKAGGDGVFGFP